MSGRLGTSLGAEGREGLLLSISPRHATTTHSSGFITPGVVRLKGRQNCRTARNRGGKVAMAGAVVCHACPNGEKMHATGRRVGGGM